MSKTDCLKLITVRITTIISFVFVLTIVTVGLAYGAGTDTINVEGKIVRNDTDHEGMNVATGTPACVVAGSSNDTCDFRVRYYSSTTGGTLYLTETYQNIEIGQYNGGFNISLGSGTATAGTYSNLSAMVKAEDTIYMEISFSPAGDGTYTETFGRMPLQSSAYAIRSKYSSGASSAFEFARSSDSSGYTNPTAGMVYFDTTTNTLKIYNGSSWEKISSGAAGTSLWSDGGTYTYLTDTADSFSLGSSSYTAIGTKSYSDYILGITSNPVFSFDMPTDRLSVWGNKKQTGLTVLSSYSSTDSWPLVTFQSNSANYASTILNVVQGGTGKIASFYKGSTEAFTFGSDQTFLIGQRSGVPSSTSDRLYNVGGVLYWNGSSICTLGSGCGVTELWSDGGTYTYLSSTTDNLVLGGNSLATAKFFFDVANGRLGIGTSTPTGRVDIRSDNPTIGNGIGDLTITAIGKVVVKAADTNPDNLQEWQSSVGTVLALINSSGYASFGGVSTGSSILSLGGNTSGLSQLNLSSSSGVDVSNPVSGDLWWNGTNLYFFNGEEDIDLLGGGDEEYLVYGLVSNNWYLGLNHRQNTYEMETNGYVCIGGSYDEECTGGKWKDIGNLSNTVVVHTTNADWNTLNHVAYGVNINLGDIELLPNRDYGMYISDEIPTYGAKTYQDLLWDENLGDTGKISVQTRSKGINKQYEFSTNGTVRTQQLSPDGKTLYIGGLFTTVYEKYKYHGGAVPIDISTGRTVSDNCPVVNGSVFSSISDGKGGWYIGGNFTSVGSTERNRIAHINSDCGLDLDFNPNADNTVLTLLLNGTTLYVGGDFASIGGQIRNRIAAIDTTTGLATNFNPNADGTVQSLLLDGETLYVGGWFTSIGGESRGRIAGINITTGLATNFSADVNDGVKTLLLDGTTLYVGGYFTNMGGQDRNHIASVDTITGLVTEFNPNADDTVLSLLLDGTTLYVGGGFRNIGGENRNCIAGIDIVTGLVTSFDPNADTWIETLVLRGTILYAGGWFTRMGDKSRNYIAGIDTTTGLVTDFNPNADNTVYSIVINGTTLYAGGSFTAIGGEVRKYIAAIDTATSGIAIIKLGTWTTWSRKNVKSLNNANDHTTWVGSGATVSDGDKTRSVTYFEDENETVAGNTTKVVSTSSGQYVQSAISSSDLSNYDYISMWVYSNQVGTSLRLSIGEDTSNLKNNDITINTANTWQKVYWNISGIPVSERDGITILRVTNLSSSSNTFYIDNISAELLPSDSNGYEIPNPAGDYIQYRVIFTNMDGVSQPKLEEISMGYNTDYYIEYTNSNTIRMYNGSGSDQYLKIKATKGDTQFVSNIPDKGDAVAFSFNTTNSIINENTKLFSVNNSGTEKMYIDAYGNLYLTGEVISNNTKYLKFSPTVGQTDGISNSNSIWINKTSTGGNLVKLQNNSTDMFVVNNTGDVSTHGNIEVTGGSLTLGGSGNIRFNSVSGEVEISKDGGSTWVKVGGSSGKIVLSAEYGGAVLSKDGTNNIGDATSNNTGSTNNSMNYYEWNSSEAVLNDIDIKVRFTLPSDFGSWGNGGITVHYVTKTTTASDNNIGLYIYEQGKTVADSQRESLVSSSAEVWKTALLPGSEMNECVGNGTTCVLDIKLSSMSNNYARVGNIVLEYDRTL